LLLPSTIATVDDRAISAISSILLPPPSKMTAITAVDDHHRHCHTVDDDGKFHLLPQYHLHPAQQYHPSLLSQ
jgi:hypothetical protein